MNSNSSRTALLTAAYRAAHQSVDAGRIFADPPAPRILGPEARKFLDEAREDNWLARYFMLHFASRSRFAEDKAEAAIAKGVRQIVVLGAGYDTFCYRVRGPHDLRLFEVDHLLTQREKRARLAEAAIEAPGHLTYVDVDFERENLVEKLVSAGFDPDRPSFFIWLGVIYYLKRDAGLATFAAIGDVPGAVEIALDYFSPREPAAFNALPAEVRAMIEAHFRRLAEWGEPTQNFIEPEAMREDLRKCGFAEIDDLAPIDIFTRFAGALPPTVDPARGLRFVWARKAERA
jgi:methyltransferase (TIGR00027 family)